MGSGPNIEQDVSPTTSLNNDGVDDGLKDDHPMAKDVIDNGKVGGAVEPSLMMDPW